MGEVQFALRIESEKRDELAEMSRDTGIIATSIARNAIYAKLEEWKKSKEEPKHS